ncbi:MAG: methyltransferase [Candidatus Anstonellales archaeon]
MQIACCKGVYPPKEDSFFMAEFARPFKGRVLDVGTGTGIIALANALANQGNEVEGVDINPKAVKCARKNALLNQAGNAAFYESDMFSSVSGLYDHIFFNPPYLPTNEVSFIKDSEREALDGGNDGMVLVRRFMRECRAYLKQGGSAYVLSPRKEGDAVAELPLFFEKLFIIKIRA